MSETEITGEVNKDKFQPQLQSYENNLFIYFWYDCHYKIIYFSLRGLEI